MINKTLGAPFGGTTVGGQYGLESLASMLFVPPNGAGGGGRYLPSIVVVALGEPGRPVVCCADAEARVNIVAVSARRAVFMGLTSSDVRSQLMEAHLTSYAISADR